MTIYERLPTISRDFRGFEEAKIDTNTRTDLAGVADEREGEFNVRLNQQVELAERRLGRPVSEAEFSRSLDHLNPKTLDFGEAYKAAFPQDRTRSDGDRAELLSEIMEDETAKANAAEQAGVYDGAEVEAE